MALIVMVEKYIDRCSKRTIERLEVSSLDSSLVIILFNVALDKLKKHYVKVLKTNNDDQIQKQIMPC